MSLLDEYEIMVDSRFRRARKEAKIIFVYMFTMIVSFLAISYWGMLSYDGGFQYVAGMPLYFLVALISAILFLVVGALIGLFYIEDIPLDAWEDA